jgi:hypothetical protein
VSFVSFVSFVPLVSFVPFVIGFGAVPASEQCSSRRHQNARGSLAGVGM